jgi:hypothetical protein
MAQRHKPMIQLIDGRQVPLHGLLGKLSIPQLLSLIALRLSARRH